MFMDGPTDFADVVDLFASFLYCAPLKKFDSLCSKGF